MKHTHLDARGQVEQIRGTNLKTYIHTGETLKLHVQMHKRIHKDIYEVPVTSLWSLLAHPLPVLHASSRSTCSIRLNPGHNRIGSTA